MNEAQPKNVIFDFFKTLLVLIVVCSVACSKNKSTAPPPPPPVTLSSEKEIIEFKFEKSLNSNFLDTNIIGTIDGDTIRVAFPVETDLSNLKPSINIKGISVTPNNNVSQNFTNAITYTVKAEDGTSKKYAVTTKYRSTVFIASTNGSLYALDARTGNIIWKTIPLRQPYSVNTGPSSSPAVGSGLVFISDHKGIYAYDVRNGVLKWTIAINPLLNGVDLDPTPLYADGTVYIGTKEGNVLALNATTGSIKWKFNHPSQTPFTSPPTLVNGTLFIGCQDFSLYAIDINTGGIKWKFPTGAWIMSNPLFFNNTLYIKSDNYYALNPETGALIWKVQTSSSLTSWTGVNGVLYENLSNHLFTYDAQTGNEMWHIIAPYTGLSYNQRSSPIIVNDRIFMGSIDGNVYAFSISSRSKVWQAATGNTIYSSPVVVDGLLYIGSSDGKVYAFDEKFGELKWARSTEMAVRSSPCVIDEKGIKHYPGISGEQQ